MNTTTIGREIRGTLHQWLQSASSESGSTRHGDRSMRRHPWFKAAFALGLLAAAAAVEAATIWTGPTITFTRPNNVDPTLASSQDRLTGLVWITRDNIDGLYNARTETGFTDFVSPADTEWATGTTADISTLKFKDWEDWTGKCPPCTIGAQAVVHLITDDIFINVMFTSWTKVTGGGFSYQRSTPSPSSPPTSVAVEYYYAAWDYYFVTAFPDEIVVLDGGAFGGVWKRTGQTFNVWPESTSTSSPTCRFFSTPLISTTKSSHFYTPYMAECQTVKQSPYWEFESIAFYLQLADANGNCAAGTVPLYRLYNNGMGGAPNHRYTTSLIIFNQMTVAGWVFEGNGNTMVFACVPQ